MNINSFQVMLAHKYEDKKHVLNGQSFAITEKLDGIRCAAFVKDGTVTFMSRNCKPITQLVEIEQAILSSGVNNIVLDGELLIKDRNKYTSKEQYKRTSKIVRTKKVKTDIVYNIFDCITDLYYVDRRKILETIPFNSEFISIVPILYQGEDVSMIQEILTQQKALNREGIMINLLNRTYECKRTDAILKLKVMQDADLLVTNLVEGRGRNKNRLGAIEVEFIHNNQTHRCMCGTGFTDQERVWYWNKPDLILNKICTIQYFEITMNDENEYGLRFPVWIGVIRNDKNEISMN